MTYNRKRDNLGELTEKEKQLIITCDHCTTTWVPTKKNQTYQCPNRACRQLVYRNKRQLQFGATPETPTQHRRDQYTPTKINEDHEHLIKPYAANTATAILELNQQNKPCFINALADYLDYSRETIKKHVKRFEDQGYIRKEWNGRGRKQIYLNPLGKQVFTTIKTLSQQIQNNDRENQHPEPAARQPHRPQQLH